MNKKILFCAATLGLLLLMLWGCVYYVPAPDGEDHSSAETTAESEPSASDTTADTTADATADATAESTAPIGSDSAEVTTAAPTERDDGFTGYH